MSTQIVDPAMAHLATSDFMRLPSQLGTRALPYKEWQHFVVQTDALRFLINFSVSIDEQPGGMRRLSPRMLVMCHGASTASAHHRTDERAYGISDDLRSLRIDRSAMAIRDDGYAVSVDLPGHGIEAQLILRPTSRPFVVNNQPVGAGRLSWLFVPELLATGTLRVDGTTHELDNAVAYHDHNWGHFRWGDDFSWMWGSVLPKHSGDLSVVTMRMTDRAGHRCFAQAMYAWKDREPIAIFRDGQLSMRRAGSFDAPATSHLPPIVSMLTPASTDVPAMFGVDATGNDARLSLRFEADQFSRIGLPDELTTDRVVTLDEATGPVRLSGEIGGHVIDATAAGLFEFCHG